MQKTNVYTVAIHSEKTEERQIKQMKKFQRIIPAHIPEEEVPNIIQRASELQSKIIYGNTKHTHREIQGIADELEIEEQYIKQALEELYNKNEHPATTKKITNKEMKFSNKHLLIIIIILLICLLAVFLSKDNVSDIVLSGNNSTLIMSRDRSIVEVPKSSIDEDQTNTQKQVLLQQQIEILENKNRLLEEQQRTLTEKKERPKSSEEQRDRTLDQERVKLQKQVQEFEQKKLEQQKVLLEEQKRILEERSKLLDERAQNSDNKQTNVTIHIEDTKITTTETKNMETIPEAQFPSPNFEGNWELVAYHLYDKEKGSFLEVPVVKDKIEIRESWYFHSGRFRHIMDKNLSFSGKYEVQDSSALPALQNTDLASGSNFIIHAYDISTNFGSQIKHHYYYVEFDNTHLILYDIGRKLQYRQPNQGHEFTKRK